MKFNDMVKKLKSSPQYESFSTAYKDPVLVAGFFVIDFENKKNVTQIDFFVPSKKKVAAFSLDNPVTMQLMDTVEGKADLAPLDSDVKVELEALEGILDDEMKNRGISETLKKIVAVLHMHEGKKLWNLNCMLSGMTLLRAHVDDDSRSVIKMEKVNLFDVMKTVPGTKAGIPNANAPKLPGIKMDDAANLAKLTPNQKKTLIKEEVKKLDEIEEQIEKTKESLKKQLDKVSKKDKKK
ncbi:MAG TPA: hypothetical protein VHA12_01775 [Candidatus Nanoarchaeia archaeon]|nr:hypothetical protein [Candidatus Nanoarchaeia archaeon]